MKEARTENIELTRGWSEDIQYLPAVTGSTCPQMYWPENSHPTFRILKGLSYEIDFENVDENFQMFALIRAAAGLWIFRRHLLFLVDINIFFPVNAKITPIAFVIRLILKLNSQQAFQKWSDVSFFQAELRSQTALHSAQFNYTPIVISEDRQIKQLTFLSQRNLALTAIKTLFALWNHMSPQKI
jgi:hypothetical protein